jgi:hypothetical protein
MGASGNGTSPSAFTRLMVAIVVGVIAAPFGAVATVIAVKYLNTADAPTSAVSDKGTAKPSTTRAARSHTPTAPLPKPRSASRPVRAVSSSTPLPRLVTPTTSFRQIVVVGVPSPPSTLPTTLPPVIVPAPTPSPVPSIATSCSSTSGQSASSGSATVAGNATGGSATSGAVTQSNQSTCSIAK